MTETKVKNGITFQRIGRRYRVSCNKGNRKLPTIHIIQTVNGFRTYTSGGVLNRTFGSARAAWKAAHANWWQ